jgi:hypothetical protein
VFDPIEQKIDHTGTTLIFVPIRRRVACLKGAAEVELGMEQ